MPRNDKNTCIYGFDPKSRGRDKIDRKLKEKRHGRKEVVSKQDSFFQPHSSHLRRFSGGCQSISSDVYSSSVETNEDSYSDEESSPCADSIESHSASEMTPSISAAPIDVFGSVGMSESPTCVVSIAAFDNGS